MQNTTFRGHSVLTDWKPIPELGNWPLAHVFVSTPEGQSWGCFGRGIADEPNAPIVCQGEAILRWVQEIAGPSATPVAGVTHQVNGVCHQAANRLLLLAGVNVEHAPGNEIATPIYGKYGLGLDSFVQIIKDAASHVNAETPGAITEELIAAAVLHVTHAKDEEIAIMTDDLHEFLNLNASDLSADQRSQLLIIYSNLYTSRENDYDQFMAGKMTQPDYQNVMHKLITDTLQQVESVIGPERFINLFKMPPKVAALYACPPAA